MDNKIGKGWGFPLNSKKAHYYNEDLISLCGKWMFRGRLEDDNHNSSDNCKMCMKKREQLK